MRRRFPLLTLCLLAGTIAWSALVSAAPLSPDQVTKMKGADLALTRANNFYMTKKFKESAGAVEEAHKLLSELLTTADKDQQKILEPRWTKLKAAHGSLELEGVSVVAIEKPTPMPVEKPAGGVAVPAAGKISFIKQVLPLLSAKCGNCHMKDTKGGFGFSTFAALQKGSKDGIVFSPGKSQGSRLVEVIETGDMPRGGGKVAKPELDLLKQWIDQGAGFDGTSPTATLASALPAKPAMPEPPAMKLDVTSPVGKETVSFSRDIAPVLLANCTGCHGVQNPGGRLGMDNFTAFIRGGESGVPYVPGTPAESILIKKLKGTAGAQMPLRKKPLDAAVIAKFEKWVSEGGKFDGPFGAAQRLQRIVEIVKSQASPHETLSRERAALAERKWNNALSDVKPNKAETKNFLVLGAPTNGQTVETISEAAEQQIAVVAKLLGAPVETPFVKGRMTIVSFKNQIDYEEYLKTNEGRQRANDLGGFWRYDGVDSLMGVMAPASPKEFNLNTLLAQQIASLYVSQLGQRTPTWFADGVGRAVAAKLEAKDPRVQRWESKIGEAMMSAKPDGILGSSGASEEMSALSYGIVRTQMMSNMTTFNALLASLRKGEDFDQAVAKHYKATPQQIVTGYLTRRGK